MSDNPNLQMTLDTAVVEVTSLLHGMDLTYDPTFDRFRVITRALNRALRANALEHEWSWYNGTASLGPSEVGMGAIAVPNDLRVRQTGDDAARLVNTNDQIVRWAFFLPRDALSKYQARTGLWCSLVRQTLLFSRELVVGEEGLDVQVPVMREPEMFALPDAPKDPNDPVDEVDPAILAQLIDYNYPDVITARAAYMYSLTDPVIQPRSQTLEAAYKDLMYQAIERDDRFTDSPIQNEFFVPVQNGIYPESSYRPHPLADERR
jgi:hypothetical protein